MTDLSGTPFTWLNYDAAGGLADADASSLKALMTPGVSDLVVMSHGWKTDQAGAQALYEPLWRHVRDGWPAAGRSLDGFVVAGVIWPSKLFRTDFDNPAPPPAAQALDTSGAQGGDLPDRALDQIFDDFETLVGGERAQALRALAAPLRDGLDQGDPDAFVRASRQALPSAPGHDPELAADAQGYDGRPGREVLLDLFDPPTLRTSASTQAALGLSDVIGGVFAGPRASLGRLLNQLSYFEMKSRAGLVGAALGGRTLAALPAEHEVRVHLIGHSFGARLVTAAADALAPTRGLALRSLTLLQGAFSHNALASTFPDGGLFGGQAHGAFQGVLGRVGGPISITNTHNDSACTLAYAIASRLSRDIATAIGDAQDRFGAMGANGAQFVGAHQSPIADLAPGARYVFAPGKVHNVLATACISEHMDVTNVEVGRFVAAALNA